MEPTDTTPDLLIGVQLDGQCQTCGKAFSRGIGVVDYDATFTAFFCQWCLLLVLDDVTGMLISEQVLDWTRRKNVLGKRGPHGRFVANMTHHPSEHAYILVSTEINLVAARCGNSPKDAKHRLGITDSAKCRIVQVPDGVQTHLHHASGKCAPVLAIATSRGATELREMFNGLVGSGTVVTVI